MVSHRDYAITIRTTIGADCASPGRHARGQGRRYDVYCAQWQHRMVCFRNALFRGTKHLYPKGRFAAFSESVELEQENGQTVFVMRSHVVMFCESGTELQMDIVSSKADG